MIQFFFEASCSIKFWSLREMNQKIGLVVLCKQWSRLKFTQNGVIFWFNPIVMKNMKWNATYCIFCHFPIKFKTLNSLMQHRAFNSKFCFYVSWEMAWQTLSRNLRLLGNKNVDFFQEKDWRYFMKSLRSEVKQGNQIYFVKICHH